MKKVKRCIYQLLLLFAVTGFVTSSIAQSVTKINPDKTGATTTTGTTVESGNYSEINSNKGVPAHEQNGGVSNVNTVVTPQRATVNEQELQAAKLAAANPSVLTGVNSTNQQSTIEGMSAEVLSMYMQLKSAYNELVNSSGDDVATKLKLEVLFQALENCNKAK